MTLLTNNIIAVQVPDDARNLRIGKTKVTRGTLYAHGGYDGYKFPLGPGSWRFLFTTKGATEEQCASVGRELPVGARYENYNGDYPVWYHSARESLNSLLKSKGLQPDQFNYALIQNNGE